MLQILCTDRMLIILFTDIFNFCHPFKTMLTCKIYMLYPTGKEIRAKLDESLARLYMDLDGGFTHEAWLLPGWLPLPSFRFVIYAIIIIEPILPLILTCCCS